MKRVALLLALLLPLPLWGQRLGLAPILVPPEGMVRSLTGSYVEAGPVEPGAAEILRGLVEQKFLERGYEVVPLEGQGGEDPVVFALAQARQKGLEYVLLVALYRWREREGGNLGVRRPAEVAFEVLLFRVEDGRRLWGKLLKERQRSLSEDLLKLPRFLRKGLRWLSARELAETLLEEALKELR